MVSYHHVNFGNNWTHSLEARAFAVKHKCYGNLSMVYYLNLFAAAIHKYLQEYAKKLPIYTPLSPFTPMDWTVS